MKTYLFIGNKNFVDCYFAPKLLRNNKVVVVESLKVQSSDNLQTVYSLKYNFNIKNTNYYYKYIDFNNDNINLLLEEFHPDYIIIDILQFSDIQHCNMFNYLNNTSLKELKNFVNKLYDSINNFDKKANVLLISSLESLFFKPVYLDINRINKKTKCLQNINIKLIVLFEVLIKKYNFNYKIVRFGQTIDNKVLNNLIGYMIRAVYLNDEVRWFYKRKTRKHLISSLKAFNFIEVNKLIDIVLENLDNNDKNKEINVISKNKITINELYELLIKYLGLETIYNQFFKFPVIYNTSDKKINNAIFVETNFQNVKVAIDSYKKNYIINAKLSKKLKKTIDALNKKDLSEFSLIYYPGYLSNIDVFKYIVKKENKINYNDLDAIPTDKINHVIDIYNEVLRVFKNVLGFNLPDGTILYEFPNIKYNQNLIEPFDIIDLRLKNIKIIIKYLKERLANNNDFKD